MGLFINLLKMRFDSNLVLRIIKIINIKLDPFFDHIHSKNIFPQNHIVWQFVWTVFCWLRSAIAFFIIKCELLLPLWGQSILFITDFNTLFFLFSLHFQDLCLLCVFCIQGLSVEFWIMEVNKSWLSLLLFFNRDIVPQLRLCSLNLMVVEANWFLNWACIEIWNKISLCCMWNPFRVREARRELPIRRFIFCFWFLSIYCLSKAFDSFLFQFTGLITCWNPLRKFPLIKHVCNFLIPCANRKWF